VQFIGKVVILAIIIHPIVTAIAAIEHDASTLGDVWIQILKAY
jgi:fumarate reductase subunit D